MSSADLVFQLAPSGADLVFGDDGEATNPYIAVTTAAFFPALAASVCLLPDRRVNVSGTFPSLFIAARMLPDRRATVASSFPVLTCVASAKYASYAARPIVGKFDAAWQQSKDSESGVDSSFMVTDAMPLGVDAAWQTADPTFISTSGAHADAARSRRQVRLSRFGSAARLHANDRVALCQDARRDQRLSRCSSFDNARLETLRRLARHQDANRQSRSAAASVFEQAVTTRHFFSHGFGVGLTMWQAIESHAQQAIRPRAGRYVKPIDPETPGCTPTADLLFLQLASGSAALLFGEWEATSARTTIVVPIRRIYFVKNTQSLIRVSDGKEIHGAGLRLSIDIDSWVWGWSASVPGRHLSDLLVSADDQVELEAQINGNAFRLVVERVARDRRFAKSTLAVSGRGRAAWLADPYATVRSFTNTQAMLAQQLMADALTENGISLGWAIDWQITDWLVAAGAWSHTGTPMDACVAIAQAAGATIQAHPSSNILRVLPRYPVAPWNWAELTPDLALPEDVCATESIEWVDKPVYNTVFVSGQSGGVLGHVTRSGTDGGTPAPMVTDPLITHTDAARQRGLSILSDTGRQALISLSLPVLETTGIILPGTLVRYTENGNAHLGLARSVDVSANFPKVRQTIRLETHVL